MAEITREEVIKYLLALEPDEYDNLFLDVELHRAEANGFEDEEEHEE